MAPKKLTFKVSKVIGELAVSLAGISKKNINAGYKLDEEIMGELIKAFFEKPFHQMSKFITDTVQDIITKEIANEDYGSEISLCENVNKGTFTDKKCLNFLKFYYNFLHLPFELKKYPYGALGFGTYFAYFSRLLTDKNNEGTMNFFSKTGKSCFNELFDKNLFLNCT